MPAGESANHAKNKSPRKNAPAASRWQVFTESFSAVMEAKPAD